MFSKDNREFRVFISSTFNDMHDERDMLNQQIFPEIRKMCWERGVNFSPVDLRWGINSEDTSNGDILSVCLGEVANSQPFFIGILGQRYGWIPEERESVLKVEHQENLDVFVSESLIQKQSITEMEIRYGVLKNTNAVDAFFYFKKDYPLGIEESEFSQNKLAQLKDNIRSWVIETDNTEHLFDGYTSLDSLGKRIRADLIKVIKYRWPEMEVPSKIERANFRLQGYIQSKRQDYIADETSISRLDKHLDSLHNQCERTVVICGPSGIGKSALLAEWAYRTKERRVDALIFEHYLELNGHISNQELVIRLLHELNAPKNGIEQAQQLNQLDKYMREQLQAYKKPVVLILDCNGNKVYNCFTDLPENVLIITTRTHLTGGLTLEVPQLNDYRRKLIIDKFTSRYSKRLNNEQINLIDTNSLTRNPLFLKTVLDEIRLFGRLKARTAHGVSNEVTAHLKYYLESEGLISLFDKVIESRENALGRDLVKSILSLIRISLTGLTEYELYELLKKHGLDCTQRNIIEVLRLFDPQLSYMGIDGGTYHFINHIMDDAVWSRYKLSEAIGGRLELHTLLADHFFNFSGRLSSLRLREALPYYLVESKQWQKLDHFYAELYAISPSIDYSDGGYLIGKLRRISDLSHSRFLASVRDSITVIMAEWDQENTLKTLFDLNKQLFFTNKVKGVDGGNELLESLAIIIEEKGLKNFSRYAEAVIPEQSTVFYFSSTIDRILSFAPNKIS